MNHPHYAGQSADQQRAALIAIVADCTPLLSVLRQRALWPETTDVP